MYFQFYTNLPVMFAGFHGHGAYRNHTGKRFKALLRVMGPMAFGNAVLKFTQHNCGNNCFARWQTVKVCADFRVPSG